MLYPLLLKAPIKEKIWGGSRLKTEFNFDTETDYAGEAWLLSCNTEGESIVKNGEYAGYTLGEVLEKWGEKAIGSKANFSDFFPIMIKLIDAKDRLSVKVNPDDTYAKINEGSLGKTEMWYIVDCESDAKIIYGIKKNITRDELRHRIKIGTLSEICNFVPVKKGDVFHIEPNMIHAMGKGMLVASVMQNNDITYRISDYGRLDFSGKSRTLHIDKAVECANISPTVNTSESGEITLFPFGIVKNLDTCDKFVSDLLELNGKAGLLEKDSFLAVTLISGEVVLSYPTGNMRMFKGDCVFVPANCRITLCGTATVLTAHL